MKLLTDEDGRRRTTEPAYTISSPGAFGSGELKTIKVKHSAETHKPENRLFQLRRTDKSTGQKRVNTYVLIITLLKALPLPPTSLQY